MDPPCPGRGGGPVTLGLLGRPSSGWLPNSEDQRETQEVNHLPVILTHLFRLVKHCQLDGVLHCPTRGAIQWRLYPWLKASKMKRSSLHPVISKISSYLLLLGLKKKNWEGALQLQNVIQKDALSVERLHQNRTRNHSDKMSHYDLTCGLFPDIYSYYTNYSFAWFSFFFWGIKNMGENKPQPILPHSSQSPSREGSHHLKLIYPFLWCSKSKTLATHAENVAVCVKQEGLRAEICICMWNSTVTVL